MNGREHAISEHNNDTSQRNDDELLKKSFSYLTYIKSFISWAFYNKDNGDQLDQVLKVVNDYALTDQERDNIIKSLNIIDNKIEFVQDDSVCDKDNDSNAIEQLHKTLSVILRNDRDGKGEINNVSENDIDESSCFHEQKLKIDEVINDIKEQTKDNVSMSQMDIHFIIEDQQKTSIQNDNKKVNFSSNKNNSKLSFKEKLQKIDFFYKNQSENIDNQSSEKKDNSQISFDEKQYMLDLFFKKDQLEKLIKEFYSVQKVFHFKMNNLVDGCQSIMNKLSIEDQKILNKILIPFHALTMNQFPDQVSGDLAEDLLNILSIMQNDNEKFRNFFRQLCTTAIHPEPFLSFLYKFAKEREIVDILLKNLKGPGSLFLPRVDNYMSTPFQHLARYPLLLNNIAKQLEKLELQKDDYPLKHINEIISFYENSVNKTNENKPSLIMLIEVSQFLLMLNTRAVCFGNEKERYDLELMTSLANRDQNNPLLGKIYLSDEGDYVVCNYQGEVYEGKFDKKIIGQSGLTDSLKNNEFINAILEIISNHGHIYIFKKHIEAVSAYITEEKNHLITGKTEEHIVMEGLSKLLDDLYEDTKEYLNLSEESMVSKVTNYFGSFFYVPKKYILEQFKEIRQEVSRFHQDHKNDHSNMIVINEKNF